MGSFSEIANNIQNWSNTKGKLIQNTCTYEVNEDFDMDFLETYLVAMKHDAETGDYFLAMWNRTHESGDSVYALNPNTTIDDIGEGALHKGDLPAHSIPGFATYFWLMPSKNTVATITFGTPRTGIKQFSYWLENFIRTESRYVRFDNDEFLGYANGDNPPNSELIPRFARTLHKNPAKKDLIINNRDEIRGVIRRVTLARSQIAHEETLGHLTRLFGSKSKELIPHEIPLTYELGYTPSKVELDRIIEAYEEGSGTGNWEDVGFKFSQTNKFGADEKEWLSKSFSKGKMSIDLEWVVSGQLINMDSLKTQVRARRDEFIALLPIARLVKPVEEVA